MLTDKQIVKCLISVSDPMEVQRAGLAPVIAEFARAIEAMVRAECVPPGYVVVPVEPTMEMRAASGLHHVAAQNAWVRMLAAAPGTTAPQAKD